jgi:CRP/FNR family transcriptional regulator, dissimilatory nitrate respiration regulator
MPGKPGRFLDLDQVVRFLYKICMSTDIGTILAASQFFSAVSGESLARLLQMAVSKDFTKGQIIFRQHDPCPGVYVVGTGLVRVYKLAPNGKEYVLHLVSPGGTFAEVAAIGRFNCPAFAQALEETKCVLLPASQFNAALVQDHQLCLQLLGSFALWVKHLVGLVEDITLRDALGRVARYLLAAADPATHLVQLPSLKKHLASHLNLTSETLSRTLRRLADMRLIDDSGDDLRVLDREALALAAEGAWPEV